MEGHSSLVPARIALAAALLLWMGAACSETSAAEAPGVAIGSPAPDFSLVDQQGVRRDLRSLLHTGRLAIVFYRSADW